MFNIHKISHLINSYLPFESYSFNYGAIYSLCISLIIEIGAHISLSQFISRTLKKSEVKKYKSQAFNAGLTATAAIVFSKALGSKTIHLATEYLRAYTIYKVSLKHLSSFIHNLGQAIGVKLTIQNPNFSIIFNKEKSKIFFLLKKAKYLGIYLPKIPQLTTFGKYIGWWNTINVIVASGPLMDYFYTSSQMALSVITRASFPTLSNVLFLNSISEIENNIRRVFDVNFKKSYSIMSYWAGIPRPAFAILHVAIPIIAAISFGSTKINISLFQLLKPEVIVTIIAINKIYVALKEYSEYRKKDYFSQFF